MGLMTEGSREQTSLRKNVDPNRAYAGDKWTPLLLLAAAAGVLGFGVPIGWAIGGLNTPVKILQGWSNRTLIATHTVVLSKAQFDVFWSLIISVFLVGGVIGGLTGAWFADRMGRKGALFLGNILNSLAAMMFFVSKYIPSVDMFFVARFIIGFSGGLLMTVVPMYMNEISPQKLSGSMGTLFCIGLCSGVFISQLLGVDYLLGTVTLWPYLVSGSFVCSAFVFAALPLLPESPKFLYSIRHEHEVAVKELARLRNLPKEMVAWELKVDEMSAGRVREKWSLVRVLTTPRLRLPLLLVLAMQGGQQLAGINAVFYYSSQIFETAGLSDVQIQYANMTAGFIQCVVIGSSLWTMKMFRRRTLFLFSCAFSSVTMLVLTICCRLLTYASWIPAASVVAVLAFVLFFGLGLGPIPYFIGAELVDIGPRPTIMALGSVASWTCNFLVGTTFPTLKNLMGENAFLIFAACTALLWIFIYLYLPETSTPYEQALPTDDDEDLGEEDERIGDYETYKGGT